MFERRSELEKLLAVAEAGKIVATGKPVTREERCHGRHRQPEARTQAPRGVRIRHMHNNTVLVDRRTKWGKPYGSVATGRATA